VSPGPKVASSKENDIKWRTHSNTRANKLSSASAAPKLNCSPRACVSFHNFINTESNAQQIEGQHHLSTARMHSIEAKIVDAIVEET
jgi:hypothetical protein